MSNSAKKDGVWFIYDGECPLCTNAAHALRIKQKYGSLHLINARETTNDDLVKEATERGYDLDEGMVIYYEGHFYHGNDALTFMARHGSVQNAFTIFCKSLFWSDRISRLTYPWMRGTRNRLLRSRKIGRIDNLNCKEIPIFKPIFGETWDGLPPVIKKHYANRPYTNDKVTVKGQLDVSCAKHMQLLAPVFWLLGTVPPINEKSVPVTVHFESRPDTKEFCFNRIFHFKGRKPYEFRSRMVQVKDNEVIEVMRFGISWRMNYLWEDDKVILRHKGYALKAFGHFIPLPITFLLGRGDAEEWSVDDNNFDMRATITHPLLGQIYEYKGQFRIS